jgi:Ion transport protein.
LPLPFRLFRAFRVFRLFKRVESLRIIIEGVIASLPGVMNAFLVLAGSNQSINQGL